jgi:signal peptidase I
LEDFSADSVSETVPETIPEPVTPKEKRSRYIRFAVDVLETLVLSLLLFAGINWATARIRVDGFSMEPNLHTGEFILVNRLAYRLGSPKLGDVIVFHYPRDPSQEYIKRVIGLPGDSINISNGQVSVNGKVISEPYIAAPPAYRYSVTVPPDSLFVLGDNRNNSSDSHNWGPLPMNDIVGRADLVYWPPKSWELIQHTPVTQASP